MRFQNASVNNKLLKTPMPLSVALNSTSENTDDQNEELEPVCKPIRDFLGK